MVREYEKRKCETMKAGEEKGEKGGERRQMEEREGRKEKGGGGVEEKRRWGRRRCRGEKGWIEVVVEEKKEWRKEGGEEGRISSIRS